MRRFRASLLASAVCILLASMSASGAPPRDTLGDDLPSGALAERLRPVVVLEAREIDRLIADLESRKFAVREEAARKLRQQGAQAVTALKQALKAATSLEVRRRIEDLLSAVDSRVWTGEELRLLRAVHVLEMLGTKEAREHLMRLAAGAADAPLTSEATAALKRLDRR